MTKKGAPASRPNEQHHPQSDSHSRQSDLLENDNRTLRTTEQSGMNKVPDIAKAAPVLGRSLFKVRELLKRQKSTAKSATIRTSSIPSVTKRLQTTPCTPDYETGAKMDSQIRHATGSGSRSTAARSPGNMVDIRKGDLTKGPIPKLKLDRGTSALEIGKRLRALSRAPSSRKRRRIEKTGNLSKSQKPQAQNATEQDVLPSKDPSPAVDSRDQPEKHPEVSDYHIDHADTPCSALQVQSPARTGNDDIPIPASPSHNDNNLASLPKVSTFPSPEGGKHVTQTSPSSSIRTPLSPHNHCEPKENMFQPTSDKLLRCPPSPSSPLLTDRNTSTKPKVTVSPSNSPPSELHHNYPSIEPAISPPPLPPSLMDSPSAEDILHPPDPRLKLAPDFPSNEPSVEETGDPSSSAPVNASKPDGEFVPTQSSSPAPKTTPTPGRQMDSLLPSPSIGENASTPSSPTSPRIPRKRLRSSPDVPPPSAPFHDPSKKTSGNETQNLSLQEREASTLSQCNERQQNSGAATNLSRNRLFDTPRVSYARHSDGRRPERVRKGSVFTGSIVRDMERQGLLNIQNIYRNLAVRQRRHAEEEETEPFSQATSEMGRWNVSIQYEIAAILHKTVSERNYQSLSSTLLTRTETQDGVYLETV